MKSIFDTVNHVYDDTTDRVFGPSAVTQEVYEVAARPVIKAAMEGVNGALHLDQINNELHLLLDGIFTTSDSYGLNES